MGDVKRTVEKAVHDVGKTAEKAVNDGLKVYGDFVEHASGAKALQWVDDNILNNNLDLYTGNLVTDFQNSAKTFSDLGEGKAVDDNLRSGIRVGAVATAGVASGGTAAVVTTKLTPDAGNRSWGELFGGLAQAGGAVAGYEAVGSIVKNIFNPPNEVMNGFANDTNPYPTTIIEPDSNSIQKVIPFIVIGVVLLTVAVIAQKKRKK